MTSPEIKSFCLKTKLKSIPDSSGEADHREHECVGVEVLQHALHWLPVDSERNTRRTEIQAAADDIILTQQPLIGRADPATYATCVWIKELPLIQDTIILFWGARWLNG